MFKIAGQVLYNTHNPLDNTLIFDQGLTYKRDFRFDKAPRAKGFYSLCSIHENKITLVNQGPIMT